MQALRAVEEMFVGRAVLACELIPEAWPFSTLVWGQSGVESGVNPTSKQRPCSALHPDRKEPTN
jgi:hypothetical protein